VAATGGPPTDAPPVTDARSRLRGADTDALVQELRRRFAGDIVAREPVDRATWLARFRA
jgi:hypothetical protein